ncbi:SusE domain-containing protein [uncultured Arcticibacterium sp.]|uniref:SusE domain-containing protein n=1 Tax=uncultured Arcticibacterium sp. TaxID=2173042 RepID=UPI0030F7BBEA
MRNLINKIYVLLGMVVLLSSCEKEEIRAILDPAAKPVVSLNSSSLELSKDNADLNALTVSWEKPSFGFNAGAQYRILVDKAGSNFAEAQVFSTGADLNRSWTNQELNNLLLGMGFEATEMASLELAVEAILSESQVQRSDAMALTAVTYLDKLDLSSSWGIVGSAAANGWDGPDMPFYKTSEAGVFVAYVMLADGEIKIRENNDWAVNYGDTGKDGILDAGGDNIAVTAGTYAVTFNANDLTYNIEALSWGIVGSAAPNGWDGPDLEFSYDPSSDQWRAIGTLADGEMKIRKNNDWGLNYGDTGADGSLEENGDNIAVSAGTYLITLNQNELTYTLETIDVPGIVGSAAPNGWDGPDVSLMPDFSREGVWVAYNVTLTDGAIKIRMNNDWAVNYGDDGVDGTLEENGADILVGPGTYDIEVNLTDFSYTLTAK